jgi:glycosyltransferase involved in cell wall biosynthesis
MIRADRARLESEDWWRRQELDFVVLYAWGDPKHEAVASAVLRAGIFLIQNLDTAGIESPYSNPRRWWACYREFVRGPLPAPRKIRLFGRFLRDFFPSLYERKRLQMMDQASLIAAVSEPAAHSLRSFAEALGAPSVANKIMVLPHPVPSFMTLSAQDKKAEVICVGRWLEEDCHQKDPQLMLAVLHDFLSAAPLWRAKIVGRGSAALALAMRGWPSGLRSRIDLVEALPRQDLLSIYQSAKILLCPSRFESFHISSAEALCCGCSIVVADHPLLSSTGWFTSRDSGSLARSRRRLDLLAALREESLAWESGCRSAAAISATWSKELHALCLAQSLLEKCRAQKPQFSQTT